MISEQSIPSSPILSNTSTSPPPLSPQQGPMILSPCAACKILRRRCVEKCVLAPYFPPTDPLKFTIAHKVFGASNIIKLLQELPEPQRADAVSSMVYEANARVRDPVYGSAGAICQLQKQVSELQAELAMAQAEILKMQCQQANLLALLCMDVDGAINAASNTISLTTSSDDQADQCLPCFLPSSPSSPLLQDGIGSQLFQSSPLMNYYVENNCSLNWDPLWTCSV